jgi:hypothetical protein
VPSAHFLSAREFEGVGRLRIPYDGGPLLHQEVRKRRSEIPEPP